MICPTWQNRHWDCHGGCQYGEKGGEEEDIRKGNIFGKLNIKIEIDDFNDNSNVETYLESCIVTLFLHNFFNLDFLEMIMEEYL